MTRDDGVFLLIDEKKSGEAKVEESDISSVEKEEVKEENKEVSLKEEEKHHADGKHLHHHKTKHAHKKKNTSENWGKNMLILGAIVIIIIIAIYFQTRSVINDGSSALEEGLKSELNSEELNSDDIAESIADIDSALGEINDILGGENK